MPLGHQSVAMALGSPQDAAQVLVTHSDGKGVDA